MLMLNRVLDRDSQCLPFGMAAYGGALLERFGFGAGVEACAQAANLIVIGVRISHRRGLRGSPAFKVATDVRRLRPEQQMREQLVPTLTFLEYLFEVLALLRLANKPDPHAHIFFTRNLPGGIELW
ncbi:hypothetical protein AB9K34_00845 [Sedimentitalea sp. XS_ASV28]|uniref:hypothetical protein n=1 Tax=Sedimentitalea sp. XS_ASV28 TaxID=3241296 RepID=UPI0035155BF3